MEPSLIVMCIVYLLMNNMAQMTCLSVQQDKGSFLYVTVGDEIFLSCSSGEQRLFWYKQSVGMKPMVISSSKSNQKSEFYGEFHNNHRFTLDNDNYKDGKIALHITDVQMSDSAVYHCISRSGHHTVFLESITVIVKDLNPGLWIDQAVSETIQPGRSVTLNCSVHTGTCDGPHRVYWFKQSEESAAGVLYSHGGSSDQCGRNTDSQTNSCVYNLPIHNVSSEQTGTYYCAVALCGQVLFGNGTRIKTPGVDPIVYVLIRALVFTSVLVVVLAFSLCTIKKKYSSLCTVMHKARVSTSSYPDREVQDQEVDELHYATLNINPSSRRELNTAQADCVYSTVQQPN